MNEIDIERANREEIRWRILRVLDAGRPVPTSETIVLRALHDVRLTVTPAGLRRELGYLDQRELIRIHDRDEATWSAELTRHGIDFVECSIDAQPGIARPKKWS